MTPRRPLTYVCSIDRVLVARRPNRRSFLLVLRGPVHDDGERKLVGDDFRNDGEKPPPVGGHVEGRPAQLSLEVEEGPRRSELERGCRPDGRRHQAPIAGKIEELPAI